MRESIGRLGEQSAVRRLTLDDTIFTYVVDGASTVSTEAFFPRSPSGIGLLILRHWTSISGSQCLPGGCSSSGQAPS
jgi:hypothetical protein